jgi:ubiquinone/menaquinone biosynthesis C-methylase UbiE
MRLKLLEVLACPVCRRELACSASDVGPDGDVVGGVLECRGCGRKYPVESGIPRFVERRNYASSFGYQWLEFKFEQVDAFSGTILSKARFWSETGWGPEYLRGRWLLDAGCGAGRFLDVASAAGAEIVGVDISDAIDASATTMKGRPNVHLVQASLYELPFRDGVFDACYCIGVIQHTPDREAALRALPGVLRPGGRIAVTIYERKPWTFFNGKYVLRPLTRRLPKTVLLRAIRMLMPIVFPITDALFRIPYLGRVLAFAIPVANYVHAASLSRSQRYQWAVLDTFDMLAPRYDNPMTREEAERALCAGGIVKLRRLENPGLNLVGERGA